MTEPQVRQILEDGYRTLADVDAMLRVARQIFDAKARMGRDLP